MDRTAASIIESLQYECHMLPPYSTTPEDMSMFDPEPAMSGNMGNVNPYPEMDAMFNAHLSQELGMGIRLDQIESQPSTNSLDNLAFTFTPNDEMDADLQQSVGLVQTDRDMELQASGDDDMVDFLNSDLMDSHLMDSPFQDF